MYFDKVQVQETKFLKLLVNKITLIIFTNIVYYVTNLDNYSYPQEAWCGSFQDSKSCCGKSRECKDWPAYCTSNFTAATTTTTNITSTATTTHDFQEVKEERAEREKF